MKRSFFFCYSILKSKIKMDLSYIITAILSLIGGGFITNIATIKSQKRASKGEADKTDIDNLREIITEQKGYFKEQIQELKERIEELEGKRCEIMDCPNRIPPIQRNTEE